MFQLIDQFQIDSATLRHIGRQLYISSLMRTDCRNFSQIQLSEFKERPIAAHLICHIHILLKTQIIHLIFQNHVSFCLVIFHHADRSVHVLIFQQSRVWCTVRIYHSVHTEITVIRILSMITAIIIDILSILCHSFVNSMVAPFPDKAATETVVFLDHFKIIFVIAGSVSHRVAVFAQNHRLIRLGFTVFFHLLIKRIHSAIEVQIGIIISVRFSFVKRTFIMCKTARIIRFRPCECLLGRTSVTAFITH